MLIVIQIEERRSQDEAYLLGNNDYAILRGIIYNRVFYPFKNVEPEAYCIFPYRGASNDVIPIFEIEMQYPLTFDYLSSNFDYLSSNEERIKANVNCREGEYWHTFTREHNQTMYNVPKIIVPMTARDTIATFVPSTGLYMDNANVWFMTVEGADENTMKAITCVINSTVFSILGKSGANPQSGGYYKFNKQFLSPIPFPSQGITEDAESVFELAHLYDDIFTLQSRYLSANPMQKETIANSLDFKWNALDNICYRLYGLSEEQIDNMTRIAERSIEGLFADDTAKLEGYADAMRFMDETVVNEDEFLRYRITERFNQILRDVYKEYAAEFAESAKQRSAPLTDMTEGMLAALDKIKSGEVKVDTIEDAVQLMAEQMGITDDDKK